MPIPTAPRASLGALFAIAAFAAPLAARAQVAQSKPAPVQTSAEAIAKARADSVHRPYTAADVHFVSGMIHHHAQAILMAGWAYSHGASESVRTLCDRIINAQTDEIHLMQQWLIDRGQTVPEPNPHGMTMVMDGMKHDMLMPGMLTEEQLNQLDKAKGTDFDRLFLSGMIQHHKGAVTMVQEMFSSYGAGEDETIFKLASDINVDQTTEIARMQKMLIAVTLGISP